MFVGVDGCRVGWLAVLLNENSNCKVDVFPDVFSLWNRYKSTLLILIDIPIGLRKRGNEERKCDKKARQLLGHRRSSSVFPAPCRTAIYAAGGPPVCFQHPAELRFMLRVMREQT